MTTLPALLAGLEPLLRPGRYVFATVPLDAPVPAAAVATFVEDEGRTLVLPDRAADRLGLAAEYPCAWITLRVSSQLAGVGLLARVTAALAGGGISVNPVSAVHHDHLFVPYDSAAAARTRAAGRSRARRRPLSASRGLRVDRTRGDPVDRCVVGAYRPTGELVGFARAVSDGVTFGYLADVFVLSSARGAGLGVALVARDHRRPAGALGAVHRRRARALRAVRLRRARPHLPDPPGRRLIRPTDPADGPGVTRPAGPRQHRPRPVRWGRAGDPSRSRRGDRGARPPGPPGRGVRSDRRAEGSDRPERFVPMLNAARSPTFYEFDSGDLLRLYRDMAARTRCRW